MVWYLSFIGSSIALIGAIIYALFLNKTYKSGQFISPFKAVFAGVFLGVYIGLIPVFTSLLDGEVALLLKLGFFDLLQTIQVFTINVGADLILENINQSVTDISGIYSTYMTCLFVAAPLLTFGFLISLFKNAIAGMLYRLYFWKDAYIFSEINEKALLLAKDIRQTYSEALIVFTNVDRDESDIPSEYIEMTKELKALVFKKDIISVNFLNHSKDSGVSFFCIGERENENLINALKLISRYNERENTNLYVFSAGAEGELLLANAKKGNIKIRRVNEIRSVVYQFLYNDGISIFENAERNEALDKEISVAIVGLGKYGIEMLKALAWFCQMDGYTLSIHAFDQDELAEEKLAALLPELMERDKYDINIYSGVNASTKTFVEKFSAIRDLTFAFVCLGDDEDNINQSANLRMLCERKGQKPMIRTVVYSTEEKEALKGVQNYSGQAYEIETIGDLEDTYSVDVLLGSTLEKLALERHLKWGEEDEFWQYEYNYRSSMASAIHMKARIVCGIPGADKEENQLTLEERDTVEKLEHRRWNAYMRSEGYVYSGSPEKSTRNNLAKMHHNIIDFDKLTEEDKRKDSSVGTK